MIKMRWSKPNPRRIDPEMRNLICFINTFTDYKTLASCCGHGVYPMTLVVKHELNNQIFEIFSTKELPGKKQFYKKKGKYYYIPEVGKYDNNRIR